MILIASDVTKEQLISQGLSASFVMDECLILNPDDSVKLSTLKIKLTTTANNDEYQMIFLHNSLHKKIALLPITVPKTRYFTDSVNLYTMLKMLRSGEDTQALSDVAISGVISKKTIDDADVTIFELDQVEPEPDSDPFGIADLKLPETPKFELPVEDVDFNGDIPLTTDMIEIYENTEHIQKVKVENDLKEVEVKKLELDNKEAKLKKEQEEIKQSSKKNKPSIIKFIIAAILTALDWLGDGLKVIVSSIMVTICIYVGYCLLSGKPVDLQVGVNLYESFKALVVKVASDIQTIKY